MSRWRRRDLSGLVVTLGLLVVVGISYGQSSPPPSPAAPPGGDKTAPASATSRPPTPKKLDPSAVLADLAKPTAIASALSEIEALGPKAQALAPEVEAHLARGLPPTLAISAMRALARTGVSRSSAAIAPYMAHRDSAVRKAAVIALASTKGPAARAALLRGLRSSDAEVRTLSASGLATVGDAASTPDLLRAFDRGIAAAAVSAGAVCALDGCESLLSRADKMDPSTRRSVLYAMLQRKPALSDAAIITAVEKMKALGVLFDKPEVEKLARANKLSRKVKKALQAAIRPPVKGSR